MIASTTSICVNNKMNKGDCEKMSSCLYVKSPLGDGGYGFLLRNGLGSTFVHRDLPVSLSYLWDFESPLTGLKLGKCEHEHPGKPAFMTP